MVAVLLLWVSVAWFIVLVGAVFGVGVGYCSVDSVCLGLYLLIWLDDFGCGLLAGPVGRYWLFGWWSVRA